MNKWHWVTETAVTLTQNSLLLVQCSGIRQLGNMKERVQLRAQSRDTGRAKPEHLESCAVRRSRLLTVRLWLFHESKTVVFPTFPSGHVQSVYNLGVLVKVCKTKESTKHTVQEEQSQLLCVQSPQRLNQGEVLSHRVFAMHHDCSKRRQKLLTSFWLHEMADFRNWEVLYF